MAELSENELVKIAETIEILIENIKNDSNPYESADKITDLVEDYKLDKIETCRPLLKSFCDLLKEKGYSNTSDFIAKQWRL
jgi:hypothetical protein